MATIRISIINESKLAAPAEVQAMAAVLQRQVSEHFAPAWGVDATLTLVAAGAKPIPGSWWLVLMDDSNQAGALGYHDLTDEAMPLGKVFVKTAQDAGVKWTVTASHELLELLADPAINLTVCATENDRLVLYAYEICDPCQADEFGYAIDGVAVSDFLFPSWFETFHRSGAVPLDYCGHISTPLKPLPGGYASVLDTGSPARAWTEKKGPAATIAGARFVERPPVPGSRRERRRRGAAVWKTSQLARAGAATAVMAAARPGLAVAAAAPVMAAAAPLWPPPHLMPRLLRVVDAAGRSLLHLETPNAAAKSVPDEINRVLDKLQAANLAGDAPPRSQSVISALKSALDQTAASKPTDQLKGSQPHELQLSLLAAAMTSGATMTSGAPPTRPLSALDTTDFYQYGNFDPGWLATFFDLLDSRPVPFPTHTARNISPIVRIDNNATIALAGDWGTGDASSRSIAQRMTDLKPDHTIHLGDIYYAGAQNEVRSKFLALWPAGLSPSAPSFALNGNHEMYSGGVGYFQIALTDPRFKAQQGLSYFSLQNDHWTVIALDTAYYAHNFYLDGALDADVQLQWMATLTQAARQSGRRVILLTHHAGVDVEPANSAVKVTVANLWSQVLHAMGGGPDYWYWGHVHAGYALAPFPIAGGRKLMARCVGHCGVPWLPFSAESGLGAGGFTLEWGENRNANDVDEPSRALNGFLVLRLSGNQLVEEFRDENGNLRWQR
ncbi:MAG TPA: metallophosphoesterase [Candidatus Binataceae bacterium]|nr:metallophosphoesterase [Candidatus Binataceae bacterium]